MDFVVLRLLSITTLTQVEMRTDVPLKAESVDLALLSQVLHHAQHPEKAVEEAFRILKPGGQLIIINLLENQFGKSA